MTTNQLLAAIIVQLCRLQTRRPEYPIEVLARLGANAREIAAAIGSTPDVVNVTKTRARKKKRLVEAETVEPVNQV